jgi:hypothetical protein
VGSQSPPRLLLPFRFLVLGLTRLSFCPMSGSVDRCDSAVWATPVRRLGDVQDHCCWVRSRAFTGQGSNNSPWSGALVDLADLDVDTTIDRGGTRR